MSYKKLVTKLFENKRLIIGLGSGRCGTHSLTHLLDLQPRANVTHEFYAGEFFGLALDGPPGLSLFCLIDMLARESRIVGDVSYGWLYFVPRFRDFKGDVKFICLKRDKQATIDSFVRNPLNHYEITENNTREEFEQYYNNYYTVAGDYAKRYPGQFRVFDTEDLNSEEGQRGLLNFAGFDDPIYNVGIKLNQSIDNRLIEMGFDQPLEIESNDDISLGALTPRASLVGRA